MEAKTLHAHFVFYRKEVDAMKAGLSTKVVQRELERTWDLSLMIHGFNSRVNKEATTEALENVFDEYRRGSGWLS